MPVIGVIGYETFNATNSPGGLTAAIARGVLPSAAVGTVEEGPIRYCVDGSTVGPTEGSLANLGDTIELRNRGEIEKFSAMAADPENPGSVSFALGTDWKP